MKRQITLAAVIIGVGLLLSLSLPVAKADDFYQGKTIRFIVGAPAGGGYDTYARAVARHIGKHIPGNPSLLSITWKAREA
jgi:tripartite-type tricarboxylate transporter receptor subunit TctC